MHVGKEVVLNMDLQDFFPTVPFGRVRGMLLSLGYGYPVATTLAPLMTESVRQPVEIEGTVYHESGDRQANGSPPSKNSRKPGSKLNAERPSRSSKSKRFSNVAHHSQQIALRVIALSRRVREGTATEAEVQELDRLVAELQGPGE